MLAPLPVGHEEQAFFLEDVLLDLDDLRDALVGELQRSRPARSGRRAPARPSPGPRGAGRRSVWTTFMSVSAGESSA